MIALEAARLIAEHGMSDYHAAKRQAIPFQLAQRHFSFTSAEPAKTCPVYRFVAGDVTLDLAVFPLLGLRQAPLSPVDGRPMPRIALAALRKLAEPRSGEGQHKEVLAGV